MPNELSRSLRAPEIGGTPQLRPVASPVDTYSRPNVRAPNSMLGDLAKSLAAFSPAMARLGDTLAENRRQDIEQEVERTFGGKTLAERNALLAAGALPLLDDPIARASADNLHGRAYALNDWRPAVDQAYATEFDQNKGDINQFVADRIQAGMKALDGHPNAQAAFAKTARGLAPEWVARHAAHATKVMEAQRDDGAMAVFKQIIQEGQKAGHTPEAIHQTLRSTYAGNRDLARISMPEQDALLFRTLTGLASEPGNDKIVEGILRDTRGGIGAIADKSQFVGRADELILKAKRSTEQATSETRMFDRVTFESKGRLGELTPADTEAARQTGLYRDGAQLGAILEQNEVAKQRRAEQAARELQAMANKEADQQARNDVVMRTVATLSEGRGASIYAPSYVKHDGTIEYMSPEKAREEAVILKLTAWDREVAAGRMTQQQAERDKLAWFSTSGEINPVWKRELIVTPFLDTAVVGSTAVPPNILEKVRLYKTLVANLPTAEGLYVPSGQDLEFYRLFTLQTDTLGLEPVQAMRSTLKVMEARRDPDRRLANTIKAEEMRRAVSAVDFADTNVWERHAPGFLGGTTPPKNPGDVGMALGQIATFYADLGLSTEVALDHAMKDFARTHYQINGWAVPALDRRVPKDFPKQAGAYLERWARDNTQVLDIEGIDADRLTVRPIGRASEQTWAIIDGITAMPMFEAGAVFTLDTLEGQRRAADYEAAFAVTDAGKVRGILKDDAERQRLRDQNRGFYSGILKGLASGFRYVAEDSVKDAMKALERAYDNISPSIEGNQMALQRRRALLERARGAISANPEGAPGPEADAKAWEEWLRGVATN